jgi:hypothetical protein
VARSGAGKNSETLTPTLSHEERGLSETFAHFPLPPGEGRVRALRATPALSNRILRHFQTNRLLQGEPFPEWHGRRPLNPPSIPEAAPAWFVESTSAMFFLTESLW